MSHRYSIFGPLLLTTLFSTASAVEDTSVHRISVKDGLRPFLRVFTGRETQFELTGDLQVRIDGKLQPIQLRLTRFDDQQFDLALTHKDYAVEIHRRAGSTTMIMPLHRVAFHGEGAVADEFSLTPKDILARLVSRDSKAITGVTVLTALDPEFIDPLILMVQKHLAAERDSQTNEWYLTKDGPISFPSVGSLSCEAEFGTIHLKVSNRVSKPAAVKDNVKVTPVHRTELEKTLVRGVHRATEILAPAASLTNPRQENRAVANGSLRWVAGQRVAILSGTPAQIGTAHGQLLKSEATRCIESVLYSFGTAHAIQKGRWFRHDLEEAYARLSPHIPARHKAETTALANSLGLPPEQLNVLNVFPELFHCSGFAVFNSATKDGKLYHGRVLDYMTTIGLQDAATTFIVKPVNHNAFANIGYAAFIGSVSGMNNKAISLGEMGGRGEGNWDGVPMATLMRRALEECSTLDEVKQLWTDSPRTCEYYYVFADGKTNAAVGVAAWPEKIEFIEPGQAHERLGSGIPDAVVLSAGSRLEHLRRRVTEKHGMIDAEVGQWLMSRPVAMQSNLHNVLFVPADGVFYVANASHGGPAAEQPYVRLDMNELLRASVDNAVTSASR